MPHNDDHDSQDHSELIRILTDNFSILADEVQLLSDRKTILEHKLRFAHEQYQQLADKYASGDSEISSTLAKLQLPPDLQVTTPSREGFVPLPQKTQTSSKLQTAVAIRDGRKAAQLLSVLVGRSGSTFSKSISGTSSNARSPYRRPSLSTVLEQDFTVQGKKSSLLCPFSRPSDTINTTMIKSHSQDSGTLNSEPLTPSDMKDTTRHQSADPICAALYLETVSSPPPSAGSASGSAAKCPIRYLDQHSPEEVARYFETHKHEIPRSHEICVKRYQRNEDDIRKLDAKYGNLVSMIQGLGQKHQPMLPLDEQQEALDLERTSNQRVENWAQAVSTDGMEPEVEAVPEPAEDAEDREGRFDRPLKEIRVGESPSRPWGISVPIFDSPEQQRPVSPPPAPVPTSIVPKLDPPPISIVPKSSGKCPFGHGQPLPKPAAATPTPQEPASRCPFPQAARANESFAQPKAEAAPAVMSQPAFFQVPEASKVAGVSTSGGFPQMIFTGPVFIGYPMEQALAFVQQYKGGAQ